ncbi:hypothetical protein KC19_VG090600 [Ceratodon purpureus]|uniref:Poly [ADP-ribose] polymerase n=1 Tax=Ceratodon purpureus TaxID=3225 RepID=A0A8T0HNF8_CERPU|nr:hypothetical protein KC19_VG090600 [Ceratodon purpureus]
MDVYENRLRTGGGDVVHSFRVVGESPKRREREGERECKPMWRLSKRVTRDGGHYGSCVHGRIVEAVVRSRGGEQGGCRIDAEVESYGGDGSVPVGWSVVKSWRLMYFERGGWVEYGEEANCVAWKRFRGVQLTAEVVVEGRVSVLSFAEMTQVNLATGYVRSIAWSRDGWEISLPANPIIGPGEENLVGARVNRLRTSWRDGATDSVSSFMLGSDGVQGAQACESEWNDADHESVSILYDGSGDCELTKLTLGNCRSDAKSAVFGSKEKHANLGNYSGFSLTLGQRFAKLDEGEKEFDDVKSKFLSGFGKLAEGATITGIHRDSSPVAMARQVAFERQKVFTEQARGNTNVRYGWLGTSKKGMAGIFLHGFGQPKTLKNGSAYGVGVYLALENQPFVSAVYADIDENGEQHVVLCQVVPGVSELVKPPSEQFHPSSQHYDTGVDDVIAPKWPIVWSTHISTHILPLFVVSFKLPSRWHRMMAELNGKQRSSSKLCPDVSV